MNVFRRVLIALALVFVVVAGSLTTVTAIASQSERPVTALDEESGDDGYYIIVDEAPDYYGDDEDEDEDEE